MQHPGFCHSKTLSSAKGQRVTYALELIGFMQVFSQG